MSIALPFDRFLYAPRATLIHTISLRYYSETLHTECSLCRSGAAPGMCNEYISPQILTTIEGDTQTIFPMRKVVIFYFY